MTVIGGDAATRICNDVVHGIEQSPTDSDEERKFRAEVVKSVRTIKAEGGAPDPVKEFP